MKEGMTGKEGMNEYLPLTVKEGMNTEYSPRTVKEGMKDE